MNFMTLKNTLSTDKQCREYLANLRWGNNYICPYCQNRAYWKTNEVKFKCQKCGHKMSVTSGTAFQGSHTPLYKWFLAIWYFTECEKKMTAAFLQRELKLGSNRTALNILQTLRKAKTLCTKKAEKSKSNAETKKLENIVEIKREFIKFHGQSFYILIATEIIGNDIGQIRIQKSEYNNKAQIMEFIKNNVVPYDLVESNLNPEQKKRRVGIITQLLTPDDMGTEYNKLIKSSSYEYHFTNKVLNSFLTYMNSKCPKDKFEQGCKRYCMLYNRKSLNAASKDVSVSFEELLNALLNMKVNK